MSEASLAKLPSGDCHWTPLMMLSRRWFRWWLSAVRQQAITWAYVDPVVFCHMSSPDHNKLTHWGLKKMAAIANNIYQWILLNKDYILTQISIKYDRKGAVNDMSALVQVMAWHRILLAIWRVNSILSINMLFVSRDFCPQESWIPSTDDWSQNPNQTWWCKVRKNCRCCATLTWKMKCLFKVMWVELWWCGFLVTWFCYAVIVKPGNKTATPPWSDQYHIYIASVQWWQKVQIYFMFFKMCFFPAVVIIAEDKSIQDKLAYYDLQAQTFSEVAPIQVYPARVLSHIFAHLGKRQCLISSVFAIEIPQSCAKLLVHLNPVYDALSISTLECSDTFLLTHWGPVTPFGDIDLGQHWLR